MKINNEQGIALPLVMIAMLIGALMIPVFLGHTGTALIGSRNYMDTMNEQYACDAGAEHAIWRLADGGLEASIPEEGDSVIYNLGETVNGLTPGITVSNACEIIARDDFESSGWEGGSGWLDDWSYSGDAAVTTSGTPYEGTYHLRLRSSTGTASRQVDLSRQVSAHLYFWSKINSFEPANTVVCLVSQNGADWIPVYTWTQADSDNTYHYYDFDLTPYGLTASFYISFAANMNSTSDTFFVDDLKVVWPANTIKLMAEETFESGNWSDGTGWIDDWTHTGTAGITGTGLPHGGSYHLLLQGPDGYAARPLDLFALSIAHLQFWAKVSEFEGGDEAYCLVSSDGVNWTTVYTWTNTEDDGINHYYDIDISAYDLTDEFWIAFEAGMNLEDDYFYVDDITVSAERSYCITVTAGGRILKAALDLMDGVEKVLCWYLIS